LLQFPVDFPRPRPSLRPARFFHAGTAIKACYWDALGTIALRIVPGIATTRRRQSTKPQVEVKSMNHRPATDCAPWRRP